ncbi:hypothetical protein RMR16_017250 [Agrobacterium sp. rho-13.3]|jgi:hypothetical protein|uniref:hypothetical protein n=1 Tax=Agrobacterium sp. rho-13.3 TaxID=3072980 RepID=UPI002A0BE08E|nr:hypothetical protein [Agrobacterium sp. rho-13.3]MDX8311946.1 hypothetical protein [Agrobacterium sp. rho-13.3]
MDPRPFARFRERHGASVATQLCFRRDEQRQVHQFEPGNTREVLKLLGKRLLDDAFLQHGPFDCPVDCHDIVDEHF